MAAGPLPIRTRHVGVVLRERLHHHRGIVGGSPVGSRAEGRPEGRGREGMARRGVRRWRPIRVRPQAAAFAIRGRRPPNEEAAR